METTLERTEAPSKLDENEHFSSPYEHGKAWCGLVFKTKTDSPIRRSEVACVVCMDLVRSYGVEWWWKIARKNGLRP